MPFSKAARAILAALVSLCTAASAAAQADPTPVPSSPITTPVPVLLPLLLDSSHVQRLLEVRQWTRDYEEWKAWFARWHSRREPGWWSARPRKEPPEPPEWLPGACADLLEFDVDEVLAEGCRAWRESERGALSVLLAEKIVQARTQSEVSPKSVWWQHIHLDALWPMTQAGSSAFGVAGVHVTLPVSHRIQVFAAPGVILMRLPSTGAGRTWSAATDWGFSYRMFDFRMPGTARLSTLHFNIARVWVLGTNGLPIQGTLYVAGFSATFNPRPASSSRE